MEECENGTCNEGSLLAVPSPAVSIKSRSYSDTSIFKHIPQKPRGNSHSAVDDNVQISPPPIFSSESGRDEPVLNENSTLKSAKRKISRPRSPFTSEKAFDLLSKLAKTDFVAKVTSSSPKLNSRRTKSKSRENETVRTVSYIYSLQFFLLYVDFFYETSIQSYCNFNRDFHFWYTRTLIPATFVTIGLSDTNIQWLTWLQLQSPSWS